VRAKIPCHSVQINLCGTIPFPCGNKSFRAAIFRFVRAKFNPCGQLAVPCEPLSIPCGHKSICAAKSRFVGVLWHFSLKKVLHRTATGGIIALNQSKIERA
jgi:hypothetical protein